MKRFVWQVALLAALTTGVASAQQILINAAGATFPYPMYSKWFDEYHKKFSNLQFNYQSIGSGGGIKQVTEGTVEFGASDGPMNDKQIKEFQDKHGFGILHFPTVMGADVPVYNVAGVNSDLNFTPEALAGIFLGKITKWNDPELMKANPGVKLPAADIIVVHRSDGSGTTYIWTDYLSKVSPEWEMKVGRGTSVNWPVGLGGKGNEGVAGQIKQVPGAIGYIELAYAKQNKLPFADMKNSSGNFITASLESVTEALATADIPDDFRFSMVNPPGAKAYPIAGTTWLLVYQQQKDHAKGQKLVEFLKWAYNEGEKMATTLDYASLPESVVQRVLKRIDEIKY